MKISCITEELEQMENSLIGENGFPNGYILANLVISDEGLSLAEIFIADEIKRIGNLYRTLNMMGFLKKEYLNISEKIPNHILDIVCPLFRVTLEGFFKAQYIATQDIYTVDYDDITINYQRMEDNFNKLYDDFQCEYLKFSNNWDEVVNETGTNIVIEKLLAPSSQAKKINIPDMIKHSEKAAQTNVLKSSYLIYRFCCAYTHVGWNRAFLKKAGFTSTPYISILDVLEDISNKYFAILLCLTSKKNRQILQEYASNVMKQYQKDLIQNP